ncbi:proline iminopeptidase [Motilibacter peucedani]|uniref:Proline iminopeptidase n=1 Tax=Motilibacter peucedani TaxID=598650 RepID=A0A420XT74_9ACTN|nr:prolyl aminopeptidase [Motilibacter peucedani]RKS80052.1 proline iminopeptidase [Motilibacter peucedani]
MPHGLYPPLEPYRTGWLEPGDGQRLWWEECGNPEGVPLLVVHGGPGGGCVPSMRRAYDPARYRIVLLDQRGCGRSEPHASDPEVSLDTNTTWHLVDDIERLRVELGVERWVLSGGSWGSALALAYAQRHPARVAAMVLRGIFTLRRSELDWAYRDGASRMLPERWDEFRRAVPAEERDDLVAAYRRRLESRDDDVRVAAALSWTRWETAAMHATPEVEALFAEPRFAVAFARIESHYVAHRGFLDEGQLIRDAGLLEGIPGVLLQGRHDVCTPPVTAWELHQAWPGSELHVVDDEGHALSGSTALLVATTDRFADLVGAAGG